MDNSGGRNKFYGRKQILAEENKLWEEENNCRGRKLSNKCIDLHAPQYLMVDLAWYHQRTMVPLDGMVPAHGTSVPWDQGIMVLLAWYQRTGGRGAGTFTERGAE